ncbi:tRNA (adenosine(37)-N6)-threonylcarbamoyltransferase complex ATPase subunit type 1 TsaE [Sulfitobacter alexandrii]|uniref:tRNA threonylcarbamoyladenosine biosynthesis protein TsaE n=1 Tax=Sulfitobacter alexandrii TaxID=1917485 RepID=A0A1J0WL32_9RHOB|nr:tRNA (adenosine(37)-N6)-threonylcarbamoyltransferase complex ATPase subunit type 1 TsaE [Sulfitobacter alexandrii]APE45073.1 tRNA (adenosine(37)-N6)-threonylcarbamoyltransferase complex ATPase subunit type 1 TsaE [Sulfitobacter alexandrii]
MTTRSRSFTFADAEQTARQAALLAQVLRRGDVILLSGDVGAGKTHFARSAIQSLLTLPEDVPSPTFTLVQTYDTGDAELWHADLYRLASVQEVEELGLIDAFETAICLVEWPDRLGELAPSSALSLTFSQGQLPDSRSVVATWQDDGWTERVMAW